MRRALLILFHLIASWTLLAQKDSPTLTYDDSPVREIVIDEEELAPYKNDPDFDYSLVKVQNTWWDNFKTWLSNILGSFFEWLFGVEKAAGYLAIFLRILPYILLIVLVYFLLRFFMNMNASAHRQNKKVNPETVLSEEEQLVKNEDIGPLIQKALADKNYRLAIRYYYLLILQLLNEKEHIQWELQKTNFDYLNELKDLQLKPSFTTVTHLYDYIWYGDFAIDELTYHRAQKAFTSLQNILRGHE